MCSQKQAKKGKLSADAQTVKKKSSAGPSGTSSGPDYKVRFENLKKDYEKLKKNYEKLNEANKVMKAKVEKAQVDMKEESVDTSDVYQNGSQAFIVSLYFGYFHLRDQKAPKCRRVPTVNRIAFLNIFWLPTKAFLKDNCYENHLRETDFRFLLLSKKVFQKFRICTTFQNTSNCLIDFFSSCPNFNVA